MSLMPEAWTTLQKFLGELGVAMGAGFIGAAARELARNDREFGWKLIPAIISGGLIGMLGWSLAELLGFKDENAKFFFAFSFGMMGQAFIQDKARDLINKYINRKEP